jgi:SAM-dependent methyltransferase
VLHHVTTPLEQERLLREVLRVLKPSGVFFLHEMNIENPLFRVYMSYVFPLLKSIDEGTELWLLPSRLPQIPGGTWLPEVSYFTFLPEFLPFIGLRLLTPLERWLERSSVLRRYSAHYMAALRRTAS